MTRPTEVQLIIMNKGMERGMIALVTELFERVASIEANLRDAAVIQLQMASQLEKIVDGTGNIRKEVERLRRSHHGGESDDLPPTAT